MNAGLEIDLLRTFVEVADARNFTVAGERLGRVQSAISMQVRRLEEIAGSRLFTRTPQKVELTTDGERLLTFARRILALNDEALAALREDVPQGPIKLGTTDIASAYLPRILARFAAAHPKIELEVVCDRSWKLLSALDRGRLDVALVTQHDGRSDGTLLLREPMAWAHAPAQLPDLQDPIPLALFAKRCIYRDAALKALDEANKPWRIAFTSASLLGVKAVVSAGLAVAPLARSMIRDGLAVVGAEEGLPPLPPFELTIHVGTGPHARNARHLAVAVAQDLQAIH